MSIGARVDKSQIVYEAGWLSIARPFVSSPFFGRLAAHYATGSNQSTHLVCALTDVNY